MLPTPALQGCRGFCAVSPARPSRPWLLSTGVRRCTRKESLCVRSAFVLIPTGDGSCDHLDDQSVSLPKEIELRNGLFEVGREPPADIIVAVPTVSTRHAMLRLENNRVSVTDLSSTNGTYLDDEELVPLRAIEMSVGTEITFGDMFLAKFKLEERN